MVDASNIFVLLVALVISTIIIFLVTKFMGEKEGLGTALVAAVIGTLVYAVVYFLIGYGLLAALAAGIVWLLALKGLYKIGWIKALIIAVLIWVFATVIGFFLPTLSGPF